MPCNKCYQLDKELNDDNYITVILDMDMSAEKYCH